MQATLSYVHQLAAGVLIGKIALLSFVVAPILARHTDGPTFTRVVRELFPAYYAMGLLSAGFGLATGAAIGAMTGPSKDVAAALGLWLLVALCEGYCRWSLTPRSNHMRDTLKAQEQRGTVDPALQQAWDHLHRQSLWLNTLVLVAGLCVLGLIPVLSSYGGAS